MVNEFGGVIFTDELANRPPEEWERVRPVTVPATTWLVMTSHEWRVGQRVEGNGALGTISSVDRSGGVITISYPRDQAPPTVMPRPHTNFGARPSRVPKGLERSRIDRH